MKWSVEIQNLGDENVDLKDILEDLGYLVENRGILTKDSPTIVISASSFDSLETADAVNLEARKLLKQLSLGLGVMQSFGVLERVASEKLEIGKIYEVSENGERKLHEVKLPPAYTAVGFAVAPSQTARGVGLTGTPERLEELAEKARQEHARKLKRAAAVVIAALKKNPNVSDVMVLKRQPQTPQNLGHIFDLIQDDLGGKIELLASKTRRERFGRSINHPKIYGHQARHIVSRQEPPPKPMLVEEAILFIDDMVKRWLLLRAEEVGVEGDIDSLTRLFNSQH